MDLATIVKALKLTVEYGNDLLDREVTGGYVGDLLSDVMANSREGNLWITRQTHQNIVAVASLKDLAGIILVQGKGPENDTLEKAANEKVPLFMTKLSCFEITGKLYGLIA